VVTALEERVALVGVGFAGSQLAALSATTGTPAARIAATRRMYRQ
jgi:hypothetical protein